MHDAAHASAQRRPLMDSGRLTCPTVAVAGDAPEVRKFSTVVIMTIRCGVRLATGAAAAFGLLAQALIVATAQRARPCDIAEPDSLGISWTAPRNEGRWLLDPQSGCRMWDWHSEPEDTSTWTGACAAG